jgi:hypothetical protein
MMIKEYKKMKCNDEPVVKRTISKYLHTYTTKKMNKSLSYIILTFIILISSGCTSSSNPN